jgi:outer membrane receptor protein involved in Fe transport
MDAFKNMPGIEAVPPQPVKDVISYKPETSWNYEAGIRSELLKDRLHAELTFFYTDVRDLQITKFVASGSGRYLSNAGKAKSLGAELSLRARLTDELTPYLNYGYTHATFLNYNNEREDFKGNYIPYIPQNTASIGLQFNKPLKNSRVIDQLMANIQCNGTGKIFWNEENNLSQPFYTVVNAQAGIRKGIVAINLWAQNLTNTGFSSFYFESFNKPFMQRGKPLQFGVKFSISR